MLQHQPRLGVDEKYLLHAIHQRVTHDDLREWHTRSPRLDAPPNALWRQAVLDGAIDRVDEPRHRLGDRFADRWAEYGEDRGGAVSYTHLRAHETPEHLVCRLLLEK